MKIKSGKKIPKHLEEFLPKYVLLYGEPYIEINRETKKYELKMSIPISDYYLNKFQEFYDLEDKPMPEDMFEILKKEIQPFMEKLDKEIIDFS